MYGASAPDWLQKKGDGFTNFERYRGLYGVHPVGNDLERFQRLAPYIRHAFILSVLDGDWFLPSVPIQDFFNYSRPDTIAYANKTNIRVLQQISNDDNNYYYNAPIKYYRNRGIHYSRDQVWNPYYIPLTQNYTFLYGVWQLNGVVKNIPNHKILPVLWSESYYFSPGEKGNNVEQLYSDATFIDSRIPPQYNPQTEFVGGIAYNDQYYVLYLDGEPWYPQMSWFTQTYFKNIRSIITSDATNYFQSLGLQAQKIYLRTFLAQIFAHEIGHTMGMKHPVSSLSMLSIMSAPVDIFSVTPHVSNAPDVYISRDYRSFRLNK